MKSATASKEVRFDNASVMEDGVLAPVNGITSKKAKKLTLEKQLEDINKELQSKSSSVNCWKLGLGGSGAKKQQRMKPEQEIVLLEQKCILLLKLKRYKDVLEDGYSILGRMGPITVIYKCILIALVKLGKTEDDIVEVLNVWKKATPKCPHLSETKRKFDGYFAALRSGMKHSDIFNNIEETLGLNANVILSKQAGETVDEKIWRFRAPPARHTTFSLCPRSGSGDSCIYGEDCLFAHSAEELKEWKMRTESDKKNNNSTSTVDTEEEDSIKQLTGKKRSIPSTYRALAIPPLCINYLQELGKKIKDSTDIKKVLTDEIAGVKFRVANNVLGFQKRVDGINRILTTWTFFVASKMPMGTVTVLHDANRENFRISTATFYNKKKEPIDLIELHPNNKVQTKLQVLNTFIQPSLFLRFNSGWPDTCYYKVDVTFESHDPFPDPGLYRQSIVFDFKKDPKVVKHISLDILPKMDPIGNHLTETTRKSVWGITPTPPSLSSPVDFTCRNIRDDDDVSSSSTLSHSPEGDSFISRRSEFPSLDQCLAQLPSVKLNECNNKTVGAPISPDAVFDSESGKVVPQKSLSISEVNDPVKDAANIFLNNSPLTMENYVTWMRDFLHVELQARQKSVSDLKKVVEVRILAEYTQSPDCLFKYSSTVGEVYGKLEVSNGMFLCDTKLERLVAAHCYNVIISDLDDKSSYRKQSKKFLCPIIEKSKSGFILAIGRVAADDLLLLSNTVRQLQLQFVLDSSYMDKVGCSLEGLNKSHMDFLFPNFRDSTLPFLKIVDGVGMIGEEEQTLNPRQLNIYNLLTGRKVLVDGSCPAPPLLLIGGVSTGKSYLIAHCIRALLRGISSHRILVCTESDYAADTYITEYFHPWLIDDQLSVQRSKPLRIYREDRFTDTVSGAVRHYCLFNNDGSSFRYPTREEVLSHKIIIVTFSTCSELIRLGFDDDAFSHIILDEVGPCLEAECIQPIILAGRKTKLLIAGDVMQILKQSFFTSNEVSQLSLLERLESMYPFKHPFVVNLIDNFDSHEAIVKFVSEVYYSSELRSCGHQLRHPSYYPLSFHHIPPSNELQGDNGGGCYSMEEIRYIVEFIEDVFRKWPESWGPSHEKDNVAIFTPYHNQIIGLQVQLQLKGIHTVTVKQLTNITGKKYRVVVISTVRTCKQSEDEDEVSEGGLCTDTRLLFNVLTSATNLIAVFGDALSLWNHGACSDIWSKYLTECHLNHSLKDFKAKERNPLKTEESFVIGTEVVKQAIPQENLKREEETKTPTLIHAEDISPSHGMDFGGGDDGLVGKGNPFIREPTSWNIQPANLREPPKTDLFSAFSTNVQPLYSSRSPLTLDPHPKMPEKVSSESFGGFNGSIQRSSVFKPLPLNGYSTNQPITPAPVLKSKLAGYTDNPPSLLNIDVDGSSNVKQLEVFRSPFQLPSMSPTSILEDLPSKFKSSKRAEENSKPIPPLIPSLTSLSTDHLTMNGFDSKYCSPISSTNPSHRQNNTSIITPLMQRGPPGFAPIPLMESKIDDFPLPDKSSSYSLSQARNNSGGGLSSSKHSAFWKSNGFEVPPRMLKNLHLASANYRSPTRSNKNKTQATVKPPPAEMNFFDELGLSTESKNLKESPRSESVTSSLDEALSSVDPEDNVSSTIDDDCVVETETRPEPDEWIEVKSTRKSKQQQPPKKSRASRDKRTSTSTDDSTSTLSSNGNSEMYFDDKVEIISQMGFSKISATKALHMCDKDLQRAVDWLICNPSPNKS